MTWPCIYQVLVSSDVTGLITLGGLARQSIEVMALKLIVNHADVSMYYRGPR